MYAFDSAHEKNAIWITCRSNVEYCDRPCWTDSDAALLPYLMPQLGSAHEWSGVWTGPYTQFDKLLRQSSNNLRDMQLSKSSVGNSSDAFCGESSYVGCFLRLTLTFFCTYSKMLGALEIHLETVCCHRYKGSSKEHGIKLKCWVWEGLFVGSLS